ncbi:MAG: hypothetical protein LBO79_09880 [Zoogloeaceae bacterium]|nr:hypothetical protein [Zoogloeaceae bacterium]
MRRQENPGGYVVHTLIAVFPAFFGTDDFETCLIDVVNRGDARRYDRGHRGHAGGRLAWRGSDSGALVPRQSQRLFLRQIPGSRRVPLWSRSCGIHAIDWIRDTLPGYGDQGVTP